MEGDRDFAVELEGHRWWFVVERSGGPGSEAMWVFRGPDDQRLEARPVVDNEPDGITARRLKDWLTRWVYERASRRIAVDGVSWKVWREPGVSLMSSVPGERIVLPPPAGLYFTSEEGEMTFLPERLGAVQFATAPRRELVRRLMAAQKRRQWRRA